jgi:hypothetical protein
MRASELIDQLSELVREHGDHDVLLEDWQEGYSAPASASQVYVKHRPQEGVIAFVIDAG